LNSAGKVVVVVKVREAGDVSKADQAKRLRTCYGGDDRRMITDEHMHAGQ
jgi:hypothetical protein